MIFKDTKFCYLDWMAEQNTEFFLPLEVEKQFVGYPIQVLTGWVNRLWNNINKAIYHKSYRKRGQYVKGFVIREGGIGFPHWHFMIEALPDHTVDFYEVLQLQLSKICDYRGWRVFRHLGKSANTKGIGVLLTLVEQAKKAQLSNYLIKEIFQNYEGSFDRIMVLTANGLQDIEAYSNTTYSSGKSLCSYGVGSSLVPANAALIPNENPNHPGFGKPDGWLKTYDFKGKTLTRIDTNRLASLFKMSATEILTRAKNNTIPNEKVRINDKPMNIYYLEEVKEWDARGRTAIAARNIMSNRHKNVEV